MNSPTQCGLLLLAILPMLGCQSARYITKSSNQGVVAIPADSNGWPYYHRADAEELMTQHFPEGFVAESEQEAVVGTTTDIQQPVRNASVDVGDVTFDLGGLTTATSCNETEWHIHYRRRGLPGCSWPGCSGRGCKWRGCDWRRGIAERSARELLA